MSKSKLTVLMAQINTTVGAIEENANKIIKIITDHQQDHDLIVFPELVLTGYPLEDLLFRKELHQKVREYLPKIQSVIENCHVILGHPILEGAHWFNSVSIIHQGQILKQYHKQKMPNYSVFDEQRYFTPGERATCIIQIHDFKIGICICEDLWQAGPVQDLIDAGVNLIASPNASPFDIEKYHRRKKLLKSYATKGIKLIYVNQIGGQDDVVFDGQSFVMDNTATIRARAPAFKENLTSVVFYNKTISGRICGLLSKEALIYKALICGVRDYVHKNNFPGVLLGLSGGIDSALTLAIAVDALGADKVHAVMMPSRYSSEISEEDALEQINKLKVSYSKLSIEPAFNTLLATLKPEFSEYEEDSTEENMQARIRAILLMALSNKKGSLLLSTSNKSESAVGYTTLYGDMSGGFAVLKDVLKTQVYDLARYRNALSHIIPERVLTRPPSAELRPNQTDQDNLPDYPTLDAIIAAYMVDNLSPDEIIKQGFSKQTVDKIIQLIKRNEYKRRQAPPGTKISAMSFGKDWRYPLTNGF